MGKIWLLICCLERGTVCFAKARYASDKNVITFGLAAVSVGKLLQTSDWSNKQMSKSHNVRSVWRFFGLDTNQSAIRGGAEGKDLKWGRG